MNLKDAKCDEVCAFDKFTSYKQQKPTLLSGVEKDLWENVR